MHEERIFMMKWRYLVGSVAIVLCLVLVNTVYAAPVPEEADKQTSLGKYVTAMEAFTMWHTDRKKIHILDVRTPQEYQYVGHPPMARNIPWALWNGKWNPEKKEFALEKNPDFEKNVELYYKHDDRILIMCRSGVRAAKAVNAMAKIGFNDVFVIVDSFEGDKVKASDSYFKGKRMKNGWKNSGAPWGYKNDPKLVYPPAKQ